MNANTKHWSFTWDTNVNQKKLPPDEQLKKFLNIHASEAIFQLEKGEKKQKEHFQGVFTLCGPRKSKISVLKLFQTRFKNCCGLTLSPVYDRKAINQYVTKEEGRVRGPYFIGREEMFNSDFSKSNLRDWQKTLFEILIGRMKDFLKDRKVLLVQDACGNTGKSWFVKWLRTGQKDLVIRKLPFTNVDRLISCVHIYHKKVDVDAYTVDLTRSTGKEQSFNDLFAALEDIKCGYVIDAMYGKANEAIFNPPMIIIFTNYNVETLWKYLSFDRWVLFQISPDKKLSEMYWDSGLNQYVFTPIEDDRISHLESEFKKFSGSSN